MRRGLKTVKYICKEYDIRGVFGPIIELLDCDDRFFTAVEVTAGNRYLHFFSLRADKIPFFCPHVTQAACYSNVFERLM